MTDTEPVRIQKWMIIVACFIYIVSFSFIIYAGYSIAEQNDEHHYTPTIEETVEESTSVEKNEEVEETIEETVPETVPEATETTEPPEETVPETEPTEIPPETEKNESDTKWWSDLELLAIVIYQEAGGSAHCDDCRRRVADVVLNRVASEHFPDTIYEVLTQKGQYGRLYWTGIKWADRASNPNEANSVKRAWRIAKEIMNGKHSKLYGKGYIWQAEFVQGTEGFWCCGHFFGR